MPNRRVSVTCRHGKHNANDNIRMFEGTTYETSTETYHGFCGYGFAFAGFDSDRLLLNTNLISLDRKTTLLMKLGQPA